MRKRRSALFGLVAIALVFSGCDWTMFGFDANNAHSSPDNTLSGSNVPALVPAFYGNTGGGVSGSPIVANGVVYLISGVSTTHAETLEAFDATGNTGCSGQPTTCVPLWTAPLGTVPVPVLPLRPLSTVWSTPLRRTICKLSMQPATRTVEGRPRSARHCGAPLLAPSMARRPVVANGDVYIGSADDNLYVFDAAGSTNCTGTPITCSPLWQAPTGGSIESSAAVDNGLVYIGSDDDNLYAFSAAGTTNCSGTPTVCSPLWTGATAGPVESAPAVANGTVYVGTDGPNTLYDGDLYAFDAAGSTNCSGSTCSPLWVGEALGGVQDSPAVSGGYVYVSELGHCTSKVDAFDAAGDTDCSGSPKLCSPLWSVGSAAYPSFSRRSWGPRLRGHQLPRN